MTAPNLRVRPLGGGSFACDHRDPLGALWSACTHVNGHETPELALQCARLSIDDDAAGLWLTHREALGLSGPPWGNVPVAEADAWRLVALAARHRARLVR